MRDAKLVDRRVGGRLVVRVVAAAALIALFGVATVIVGLIVRTGSDTPFEPARFRAAAAREDRDELEAQARAAVAQGRLAGMSETQLRSTLGHPSQTYRRPPRYVWNVGDFTASGGPGSKLSVLLDRKTRRVVDASIEPG